jgi:predicted RNA-binding Zn-ribbon protein involved in translation (DUF1610 family)
MMKLIEEKHSVTIENGMRHVYILYKCPLCGLRSIIKRSQCPKCKTKYGENVK